jgi:PAS domain S-box-containing protein
MSKVHKLPSLLKYYSKTNYATQQRAKFLFYLYFSLLLTLFLLIALRLFFHSPYIAYAHILVSKFVPLLTFLLLFITGFVLLIKGHIKASSVILLGSVLGVIWCTMFMDKNQVIARLNTIVYVFTVLAVLPLLIQKRNFIILLTAAVNIVAVIGFTIYFKDKLNLSDVDFWDYIIDNSVALAFVGFVGFYMNKVYSNAIEQAQIDLQKRLETEKSLVASELKYREITESLPQIVFEIDLTGRVSYINQIGLDYLGYSPKDIGRNIFVTDFIVEKETIKQDIEDNIRETTKTLRYTAIKKDKSTFPIQVYAITILKEGKPIGLRGIAIDITDEINKQRIIKESEERFSAAFISNPAPMAISDIETGLFIDVNDNWTKLIEHSRDEHIGRTSMDLNYWFDYDDRFRLVQKLKEKGFFKDEIVTVRTKSGKTLKVKWSAEVIALSDRKVMLSLVSDETEKIKAEKEIRESRELFKTLIDSNPNSVTLFDSEGKYLMVNKTFANHIKHEPHEIIGKTPEELGISIDADDKKFVLSELFSKGFIYGFETRIRLADGSNLSILIFGSIVDVNNTKSILLSTVDITERKALENKLKESETLFKLMVNMVPFSILIRDEQDRCTFANQPFYNKYNLDEALVLGKSPQEIGFQFQEESQRFFDHEIKKKGTVQNVETSIHTPNNETLYALVSYQPVIINEKPHSITTTVDITDRRQLEDELNKYNEQLEFLVKERTEELEASNEELIVTNEELYTQREHLTLTLEKLKEAQEQLIQTEKMASLGVLTAGVAHEINNPINYIYNGAMAIENFLADNSPENFETLKPLFEAINTGIHRVTGIVKSLNKYSRKDESLLVECNLNEILENALAMLFNQYKKRIKIAKEYADTPPTILANEGEMHQVFINILINAIQAIENKGSITVKTKITDIGVSVYIKDSGIGIQSEYLNKIFDPFFTTKDPGKGTGLGLAITKRIIQEHKGTINCYSEPNKGTEFIITFPKTQGV